MHKVLIFLFLISVCCAIDPNSVCLEPLSGGQCLARMERFGYDTSQGKCVMFVYGGCRGNTNNFYTMEDCQQQCEQNNFRLYHDPIKQANPECTQPPAEAGLCKAYFPRYTYYPSEGICRKFIYGGCGGNGNKFETLEQCKRACGTRKTN